MLMSLVIWQGSFDFGEYAPTSPEQTYVFWGLSTVIFLLTVLLGFMLFRTAVKMYIERHRNLEGSRIRTKLVVGALALTFLPSIFLVIWSVEVLNRNLDKWFSRPASNVKANMTEIGQALSESSEEMVAAQAKWLSSLPAIRNYLVTGHPPANGFRTLCEENRIDSVYVERQGGVRIEICSNDNQQGSGPAIVRKAPIPVESGAPGLLVIRTKPRINFARIKQDIDRNVADYNRLEASKKETRTFYIQLLVLITLFLVFVATWIALFLARQLVVPISALLDAVRRVRGGNLHHRVDVAAIDELATLVHAFNEMTETLESNSRELEERRRFTEAILESIPTGVISLSYSGEILRINRALPQVLPPAREEGSRYLSDLFHGEEEAEIRHLMKRAQRTGACSAQLEVPTADGVKHLGVTVSALESGASSGFVLVLEDNSEMLRTQKAAAWREVARRIAHEIKNPLTPISLCSERIARQLNKGPLTHDSERILRECVATIVNQVESLRSLVDEFSQFARFPNASPVPGDLNQVVEEALSVFSGRLDGIEIRKDLSPRLPQVNVDREQFKRVLVNLVDNAADAMAASPLRRLYIGTQPLGSDSVELIVADTGYGISPEDKAKLFLPYFSTKGRGTGLGLAIVSHIVNEHGAQIRVESNQPQGARFIIEIPAIAATEPPANASEVKA
jgi:two-component system, NtrC family, nitrogen regulation sensor histidine kinase NtrY